VSAFRLGAGILAGRLAASVIRAVGAGGATTMPGRVARALAPGMLTRLGRRLGRGSVLITGTNGKTTTARLLTSILARAGLSTIHNRAGANLPAGIATALLTHSTVGGDVRGDIGVFEVDEATLPLVAEPLRPRAVMLGNLFRDQLDRYGEIDLVADRWRAALATLGEGAIVLYNADDPLVADVGRMQTGVRTFGIDAPHLRQGATLEHAADARYCYRCGIPYRYAVVYLGHLGVYQCDRCGTARPPLTVAAEDVHLDGMAGSTFTLSTPGRRVTLRTVLPGLYNVYNVLAAASTALALGMSVEVVADAVRDFVPAFGRGERIMIDDHPVTVMLAKNPAGFNEVLRTILASGRSVVVVIAINDLTADGRDISWLWDVDFEMLRGSARAAVVTGLRAADMAVRLKYAGLGEGVIRTEEDEERAIHLGLEHLEANEPLYVLPTYTAMLRIRQILARWGHVKAFWED
jgi:UDP-N-acetylmuramyl tripeptide synthase